MNSEELIKKLRDAFMAEAEERLNTISTSLAALEEALPSPEQQKPILEILFREVHSLKGASRVVNLEEVESLSQSAEETFGALKRKEILLSPALFEEVCHTVDSIKAVLMNFEKGQTPVRGVA
jgi:two-component system chemotaxis sensor kinase CheA